MYGDIVRIKDNLLMVEGQIPPRSIIQDPDVANALLYKTGNTLYIIDTGATMFFRKRMLEAVAILQPFDTVILLNSHAHPDHTPNNSIINGIGAKEKQHYISEKGISSLDYGKYFMDKYRDIGSYYNILDGPRPPFDMLTRVLKPLQYLFPGLTPVVIKAISGRVMNKFKPLEPSKETAVAFETLPRKEFLISGTKWTGWDFNGDVLALEARGHSPDEVVFYIPEAKLLFLGDETVDSFNCWPDSSARVIEDVIAKSISMAQDGKVEVLASSHFHEVLYGEKITPYLRTLLDNYAYFRNEIAAIVRGNPGGLTIRDIYMQLRKKKDAPQMQRFFELEFPKMPGFLKTIIAGLLVEEGYKASGPDGSRRFSI